jgi:hypothetical protein
MQTCFSQRTLLKDYVCNFWTKGNWQKADRKMMVKLTTGA